MKDYFIDPVKLESRIGRQSRQHRVYSDSNRPCESHKEDEAAPVSHAADGAEETRQGWQPPVLRAAAALRQITDMIPWSLTHWPDRITVTLLSRSQRVASGRGSDCDWLGAQDNTLMGSCLCEMCEAVILGAPV
eukprot:764819-Hanusia_phi.AAC.3